MKLVYKAKMLFFKSNSTNRLDSCPKAHDELRMIGRNIFHKVRKFIQLLRRLL